MPVRMLPAGPTASPLPLMVKGSTVAPPAAAVAPVTGLGVTTLAETLGTGTAWMLVTPCGVMVGVPVDPAVDSLPMGFSCVMVSEGCTLAVMVTGGRMPERYSKRIQLDGEVVLVRVSSYIYFPVPAHLPILAAAEVLIKKGCSITLPARRAADPIICCVAAVAGCCSCMIRVVGRFVAVRAAPAPPGPRPGATVAPPETLTGVWEGVTLALSWGWGALILMLVVFNLAPVKPFPNDMGRTCREVTVVPPGVVVVTPPVGVATAKRELNCWPGLGFAFGVDTFEE